MGSRYGRNQKRKHREAIELLTEAVGFREKDLNKISNKLSRLEKQCYDWDDEIIHILRQKYSSFSKDVQTLTVRHFRDLEQINEPAPLAAIMDFSKMPDNFVYNPIRLISFLCKLSEKQLQNFRRIITLHISNGKQLAYAINIEDLHTIKNDPKFRQFLAERIAHEFAAMV